MRRAQYPEEAPVFEFISDGSTYVLSPSITDDGGIHLYWFSCGDGCCVHVGNRRMKPLTRAARELLAWNRQ